MKTHKCRASEGSCGSPGRLSLSSGMLATCLTRMCSSLQGKGELCPVLLRKKTVVSWKEESSPQCEAAPKARR